MIGIRVLGKGLLDIGKGQKAPPTEGALFYEESSGKFDLVPVN